MQDIYEAMGLATTPKSTGAICRCPWCDREDMLFIHTDDGRCGCNACDNSGNHYTVMRQVHKLGLETTSGKQYNTLAQEKGISVPTLKAWEFFINPYSGDWTLPIYNNDGKIINLSHEMMIKGKVRMASLPKCKMMPFGMNLISPSQKTIWVAEGAWDGPALYDAISRTNVTHPTDEQLTRRSRPGGPDSMIHAHGVIAAPGAKMWRPDWYHHLTDRVVNFVFDNDHPQLNRQTNAEYRTGFDGQIRAVAKAGLNGSSPSEVRVMFWGPDGHSNELADGYDIRDLIGDSDAPHEAVGTLLGCLQVHEIPEQQDVDPSKVKHPPIECKTFTQLQQAFKGLHITQDWKDTFAVMLATNLSTFVDGDQLWLRVISPPSGGKTLLAECISYGEEYSYPVSSLTGLKSGFMYKNEETGEMEDVSLIAKANGRNMVVKDGDTLLNGANVDQVLAEFRDVYDGVTRSYYKNNRGQNYENLHTSFTLCGTSAVRKLNRANLGDRFLDIELVGLDQRQQHAKKAIKGSRSKILKSMSMLSSQKDKKAVNDPSSIDNIRKRKTHGFLQYLHNNMYEPSMPDSVLDEIESLADWCAHMRSRVHDDEKDNRPVVEFHTRISNQLIKLAACLCLVLGKQFIDTRVLQIVKKVVWDTADGYQRDAVVYMYRSKRGFTTEELADKMDVTKSTAQRVIKDLQTYKMVQHTKIRSEAGIKRELLWTLTPRIAKLCGCIVSKRH